MTNEKLTPTSRIFVAGHRGLVGSAICRNLEGKGYSKILTKTRDQLDLCDSRAVADFFAAEKPEFVILAAAKVGGILANDTYRADFIADNLAIQLNVIQSAHRNDVDRLLFLGSSCIYPRNCPQPMKEEYLLTGPLESTNQPYALAKIAGIEMCDAFNRQHGRSYQPVMPTNLYGPNDNFDLKTSHVLPALIRKFHEAKVTSAPTVTLWGTGKPKREFLHVDDLAEACVFLLERDEPSTALVNIGTGSDVSITELAELIATVVGFEGTLEYDTSKPDGTPRKLLDVSRLRDLGWSATIPLAEGLRRTYDWFLEQANSPGAD